MIVVIRLSGRWIERLNEFLENWAHRRRESREWDVTPGDMFRRLRALEGGARVLPFDRRES